MEDDEKKDEEDDDVTCMAGTEGSSKDVDIGFGKSRAVCFRIGLDSIPGGVLVLFCDVACV